MNQFIIEIDEGTEFDSMPEDQQKAITAAGIEWVSNTLYGTAPKDGKQLILVLCKASRADVEALILAHGYTWVVLADESTQIDQSALLPYYVDVPVFDESGEQTGVEPVTDLTDTVQTYASHNWIY